MMKTKRWSWPLTLAALVAACDVGPTEPAPMATDVSAQATEVVLASVVTPNRDALASAAGLPESVESRAAEPGETRARLGELSPERLAARWIGHAERSLTRAQRAAGPNPQPPISAWLDAAAHLLGQANGAFDQGNYQAAIAHAKASVAQSQKVLDALAPDPDPVDQEAVAARTIAVAEDLLETAVRLAGDDPRERIAAAIEDARSLLAQAKDAFGARDFREAVGLARQSAARSSMVIRALSGGDTGGRGRD